MMPVNDLDGLLAAVVNEVRRSGAVGFVEVQRECLTCGEFVVDSIMPVES